LRGESEIILSDIGYRIRLNHLAFTALCEYLRLKIVEDIVLCVSCKLFGSESFHYTMFQMVMTELKEMVIGAISKSTIFWNTVVSNNCGTFKYKQTTRNCI